jgi:hypothetical protein
MDYCAGILLVAGVALLFGVGIGCLVTYVSIRRRS